MTALTRPRRLGMWIIVGLLAVAVVVLGSLFVGGLALADEAGEPLDVPAVAVTPGPSTAGTPSPTPTPSDDSADAPTVVDELPPVTVELDDHGGDNGNSGSGNSGSGDGGSGGSDD